MCLWFIFRERVINKSHDCICERTGRARMWDPCITRPVGDSKRDIFRCALNISDTYIIMSCSYFIFYPYGLRPSRYSIVNRVFPIHIYDDACGIPIHILCRY